MTLEGPPPRSDDTGAGPRAFIVTALAAFVRPLGGWVAVADLIRLMAPAGIDDQALRSAVSRLKRRGFVEPERRGRQAGYRLSEEAERILAAGDRRIFRQLADNGDDRFVLVVFSVPERERQMRHVLRSRLAWLGCGNAAAGVWVAPAAAEQEIRALVAGLGLEPHVLLFRSEYLGPQAARDAVADWWDLDGLVGQHERFLASWEPVLLSRRAEVRDDDARAFVDYLGALTDWRRLPFLDPGLPSALLPATWVGRRAGDVFGELHERLQPGAMRHAEAALRPEGRPSARPERIRS